MVNQIIFFMPRKYIPLNEQLSFYIYFMFKMSMLFIMLTEKKQCQPGIRNVDQMSKTRILQVLYSLN